MTGRRIIHSGAKWRGAGWQRASAWTIVAALALFVHVLVPVLFGPHMVRPRLAGLELAVHCRADPSSQAPQRSRPKPPDCPICRHVASAAAAFVPGATATEPTAVAVVVVPRPSIRQIRLDHPIGIARPRAPPIG